MYILTSYWRLWSLQVHKNGKAPGEEQIVAGLLKIRGKAPYFICINWFYIFVEWKKCQQIVRLV